jgi:hypothetical protein
MAKECESQMSQKNNLLSACRNVTEKANILDLLHFTLKYSNVPNALLNSTYISYAAIRHLAYPYVTENIFPEDPQENQVEIYVRLNNNSSAFNLSIEAPLMNVNFTNVRLNPLVASLLQVNPQLPIVDRIGKLASPLYYERKIILFS